MCKFCLKISFPKIFLIGAIVLSLGLIFGAIKSFENLPGFSSTPSPLPQINAIEISADKKSILNAETKEVIFTVADTQKYLKDSGYAYNPDTFQTTNAKYEGDCFMSALFSNKKDRIVFSTGCLPGDLPQAWFGVYNLAKYAYAPKGCSIKDWCVVGGQTFQFLIGGSGRNFVWSADDETITYEADLGESGLTETRTIDSVTGEILERKNAPITSDKKIYTNKKYGYSISYPVSWYIETVNSEEDFTKRGNDDDYIGGDTAWSNYPGFNYNLGNIPADYQVIGLLIYKIDKEETIDNFIKKKNYEKPSESKDFSTASGLVGKQYIFISTDHPVGFKSIVTLIKESDGIYVFNGAWEAKNVYDQILSTFKFTK